MNPDIFVVTGLGIGEETKGATVEWLTRQLKAHTVIRSGGCQSGHHLIRADGTEQMLSHFGSGVFEGARTHLKHMVINPVDLFTEAEELEGKGVDNPLSTITISSDCISITPFHGALSRIYERCRGKDKKGTIGMGVGEAVEESKNHLEISLRAGEFLGSEEDLLHKVGMIRERKLEEARLLLSTASALPFLMEVEKDLEILKDETLVPLVVQSFLYLADLVQIVDDRYLNEIIAKEGKIVCEPSHGALLHPRYGFVPHVTQIDPTSQDVLKTLRERVSSEEIFRLGVSRCYMTRHGAGPLPSFSQEMTEQIQETHNAAGSWWLGEFRNGYYDLVTMQYAINISGGRESFNGLMISFLDVLTKYQEWPIVEAYVYEGEPTDDLDQYFDLKDKIVIGIKVHSDTGDQSHLDHQARLTQLIKNCRPVLTTLRPTTDKSLGQVFLDYIEEKLHIPVVAVSRGPMAEDKEIRPGWEYLFNPIA